MYLSTDDSLRCGCDISRQILLHQLQERRKLDDETALYLAKRVRERLAEEQAVPSRDLADIVRKAAARHELAGRHEPAGQHEPAEW